jgi:hypothetical protein
MDDCLAVTEHNGYTVTCDKPAGHEPKHYGVYYDTSVWPIKEVEVHWNA